MSPATIKLAIYAAAIAAVFFSGWQVHSWKVGAEHAAEMAKIKADYVDQISQKESIISEVTKRKNKVRVVYREIRNEVQSADLGTCNLSAVATRLLMVAAGANAASEASEPDGALPRSVTIP